MKATLLRLIAPAFLPLVIIPLLFLLMPAQAYSAALAALLSGGSVIGILCWRIHKHFIRPARTFRQHLA